MALHIVYQEEVKIKEAFSIPHKKHLLNYVKTEMVTIIRSTYFFHNKNIYQCMSPLTSRGPYRVVLIASRHKKLLFSNCFVGAKNLYGPLSLCSESIARVGKNQKPVFPDLKPGFMFEKPGSELRFQDLS